MNYYRSHGFEAAISSIQSVNEMVQEIRGGILYSSSGIVNIMTVVTG